MKLRPAQMSPKAITRWVVVLTAIGSLMAAIVDGFQPAIFVAAALSLAGALTGLALPGRRTAAEGLPAGAVPALETSGG